MDIDKLEKLEEMLESDGFKVFVSEPLDKLLEDAAKALLAMPVQQEDDAFKLALVRAEYEGARKIVNKIRQLARRKQLSADSQHRR